MWLLRASSALHYAEIAAKERGTRANAPDDEADIDAATEPVATSILG